MVMALSAVAPAVGQDTICSRVPAENYFYNYWDDTLHGLSSIYNMPGYWGSGVVNLKGLCTKDTLTVYGIAASFFSRDHLQFANSELFPVDYQQACRNAYQQALQTTLDTSLDSSYEYLVLYTKDATGNIVQANHRLQVNLGQTPVAYYQDMDVKAPWELFVPLQPSLAVPVYERYFDTPTVVFDSFYVGFTAIYSHQEMRDPSGLVYKKTWPMDLFIKAVLRVEHVEPRLSQDQSDTNRWFYHSRDIGSTQFSFVFPILTPNPDTEGIDTTVVDTTGWRVGGEGSMEMDSNVWIHKLGVEDVLLERYVQLMPNPAEDRVRVISSFGLVGLEIYGADGRKVRDERLEGLAADVDVCGLPRGVYMVRILTPRGDTTKRLVLR